MAAGRRLEWLPVPHLDPGRGVLSVAGVAGRGGCGFGGCGLPLRQGFAIFRSAADSAQIGRPTQLK